MQEKLSRSSEPDFRQRSAVRQRCKWRAVWGLTKWRKYLSNHTIDKDLLVLYGEQWAKGNKGEWGKWI